VERTRRRNLQVVAAILLSLLALRPLGAGDHEISVRVLKIKGSGKAEPGAKPVVDDKLSSVKSKLESLPFGHARYDAIPDPEVKRGAAGALLTFDLPHGRQLEVQAKRGTAKNKIGLHLRVTREDERKKVRAEVVSIDTEVDDGDAIIQKSDIRLDEGGSLLYAVTASTRPL
jgi:hypothetical protein